MQAWHMQHWNGKHSYNVSATVCTALPSTIKYIMFYYSVMLSLVLCFICIIKNVFLKPWTSFLDTVLGKWQKEEVFITTRTFIHRQEVVANSREQSPSLKANGHSACREILVLIWNLKLRCGVHSSSKRVK